MTGQTPAPRYDMYRLIHKGLRAWMADTLAAAGTLDTDDDREVAAVLARVRGLLDFCAKHVKHENTHVHAAMEARAPGSTAAIAAEHEHHATEIAALEAAAAAVESARGAARADAAHALYRRLAAFVGENLVHMEEEEGANNAVLWAAYTDAELMAIEHAIVESQSPDDKMLGMRWIIAAATPAERAALLSAVRPTVPAEAFAGLLEMLKSVLPPAAHGKLVRALAAPALAA
ncbi:hypothetical protein [Azospirillum sp.]|uniref:hemerythrin domain-containing protein n=1 Tax=Azospirillum sp. TaxID=34012 RepID=UPI002D3ED6AE|nr:hypothetical protein [Azospirillum sp.]HYD65434.1 hypothetical protein [Azospirillum sp.]